MGVTEAAMTPIERTPPKAGLSHDPAKTRALFDDRIVSRAGLVPVMALAQRCGLADLAGEHVTIASPAGVNPYLKIPCWSRAWPPGRTISMTWTSCGTAP